MPDEQDRKTVLLKAAYELLKQSARDHSLCAVRDIDVHYDGTSCDGYILMEDIKIELDLED